MAKSSQPVTSIDVAREAGVSQATVSYVLNATSNQTISPGTRQRVRRAAAKLGYAPSESARALRTGRAKLVLAMLPDWPIGPVTDGMLSEISKELSRRGFTLLIHRCSAESERRAVWRGVRPTGIIAYEPLGAADLKELRHAGVHVGTVMFDPAVPAEGTLVSPQGRVGNCQVDYLVGKGHRRLGYAMPADVRVQDFAEQRLAAVRAACRRHGLPAPSVKVVDLDLSLCTKAIRAWTRSRSAVTAICAYNDEVAIPLLTAIAGLGLSVPDDLALVGVDDIPLASVVAPPLTTVRIDPHVLAQSMAELLAFGKDDSRHDIVAAVELVVRSSA